MNRTPSPFLPSSASASRQRVFASPVSRHWCSSSSASSSSLHVGKMLKSDDPRDKILALFSDLSTPMHPSWHRDKGIETWVGIEIASQPSDSSHAAVVTKISLPSAATAEEEEEEEEGQHQQRRKSQTGCLCLAAMRKLPELFPNLRVLDLGGRHRLDGECDLKFLPRHLQRLDLSRASKTIVAEGLRGSIDDVIVKLPLSLTEIDLSNNFFSATSIDWAALAEMKLLRSLNMSNNFFGGTVDFAPLQSLELLTSLQIHGNRFASSSSTLKVRSRDNAAAKSSNNGGGDSAATMTIVPANLSRLPRNLVTLRIDNNPALKFCGEIGTDFLLSRSLDSASVAALAFISVSVSFGTSASIEMSGDDFYHRCRDFNFLAAADDDDDDDEHSDGARLLLCLFAGILDGLPPSWHREYPPDSWSGIKFEEKGTKHGPLVEIVLRGNKVPLRGVFNFSSAAASRRSFAALRILDLHDSCNVSGHVDLQHLPPCLEVLDLSRRCNSNSNQDDRGMKNLCGELELAKLPVSLRRFNIAGQSFTNSVNDDLAWPTLSNLAALESLILRDNKFRGSVELYLKSYCYLPVSLTELDIRQNPDLFCSASIDVAKLPKRLRFLFDEDKLSVVDSRASPSSSSAPRSSRPSPPPRPTFASLQARNLQLEELCERQARDKEELDSRWKESEKRARDLAQEMEHQFKAFQCAQRQAEAERAAALRRVEELEQLLLLQKQKHVDISYSSYSYSSLPRRKVALSSSATSSNLPPPSEEDDSTSSSSSSSSNNSPPNKNDDDGNKKQIHEFEL